MMVCVGSVLLKKPEYKQRVESLRSNRGGGGGGVECLFHEWCSCVIHDFDGLLI